MKNKTCFCTGFILLLLVVSLDAQQYVTLEGKHFKLNGGDFYPIMTNYSVETIWDQVTNQTFVAPNHCYDTSFFQEGNSQDSCLSLIQRDFDYIAGMGFNGVRFYSFYPKFNKSDSSFVFYRNSYDTSKHDSIFLDPTNPQDTSMKIVFKLYDQLLEMANNTINNITDQPSPLKIIFIITGFRSNYSDYEIGIWNDYLNSLSRHLDTTANNDALFAYDLINEPCYSVLPTKNKTDACDMVSAWYNTIKANDKKHLVTIGSCGYGDVFSFDPSILKVDFYSLHCYPYWRTDYEDRHNDTLQKRAWERLLNQFYWIEHNSTRPWMIGEIGLSASINYTIDSGNMDGTLTDQANFASFTLNASRDCGASGYSWAGYQDIDNNSFTDPGFSSDFLGIIERYSVPGTWSEKPAVDTFRNWNYVKEPCPFCYSSYYDTALIYYNPYQHPTFDSTAAGYIKTAYVVDQDNAPIKDAYVGCFTWMSGKSTPSDEDDVVEYHNTFTDATGFFQVIPYDYVDIINDSAFVYRIELAAASAESKIFSLWDFNLPANYTQIDLNKIINNYYGVVNNVTIASGNSQTYKGYYSLLVQDVTIQNNASADFYASYQVHLKPGFTSYTGSNVRLFCADTAYSCSDYSWSDMLKKSNILISPYILQPEVELQFKIEDKSNNILLYPNPGQGLITIRIQDINENSEYFLTVTNMIGSAIYFCQMESNETTIDFSSHPKGMYFVNIKNHNESFVKKIIIQ